MWAAGLGRDAAEALYAFWDSAAEVKRGAAAAFVGGGIAAEVKRGAAAAFVGGGIIAGMLGGPFGAGGCGSGGPPEGAARLVVAGASVGADARCASRPL